MNVITGLSRLIVQEKNLLPPKILKYALEIRHAGDNLLAIINDILDLTKIEAGKIEIVQVKFTLSSLLEDVITIMRPRIYDKGLQFITFIDCRLPNALFGDIVHIRQILLNILGNAAKYTREGHVAFDIFGTKSDKNTVLITFVIRDTGIGIKEEDKSRIFADFVQVDSVANWNVEGTGLGLPIAKELIHQLGGTISMISQYHLGTTFTVVLPVEYESELPFARIEDVSVHHILIFEPRPLHEQSLIRTLEQFGVKYLRAPNVSQFNELLQKEKFTHVFIASFAYDDVVKILETPLLAGTQAVLLCESAEQIRMQHTRSIMLPINAANIADLLNHTYRFEEDSGLKFYFKMPMVRILVVDDNRPNLLVAEGLLAPYECQLDFVTSGYEAIRLCKLYRYDLIFMDHMMPEMDGIEATLKIRALSNTPKGDKYFMEVPIIALTANSVFGMKEVFLQHGMNDFLPKPIDPAKLEEILETWIPEEKRQSIPALDWRLNTKKAESGILIPGVNTRIGIIQTGGTIDGYIQVISTMCKEMEGKIEAMQKALQSGNLASYKTYVHSYKSMLATVGVMPLSVTAAMLEIAAQNEDRATIDMHHDPFIRDLRETGESVLKVLEQTENAHKGTTQLTDEDKALL
jgi:CheY-like chemotaxis protein